MTFPRFHRRPGIFFLGTLLFVACPALSQQADRSVATGQPLHHGLTQTERNKLFVKALFNPISFVESAASAGWGQLRDRPEEWHEGGAGFGRRYASSFAQHITRETLNFALASALHEDNRYVPSGKTRILPRVLYALESTLQSRDDNGVRQVSYSNIGSLAGASMLSRIWQPGSTGGARSGAANFGISVAFAAGMNVVHEFIHR